MLELPRIFTEKDHARLILKKQQQKQNNWNGQSYNNINSECCAWLTKDIPFYDYLILQSNVFI